MRHIIHLGGVRFTFDGEQPKTHVVIGQRDEEYFRPKIIKKDKDGKDFEATKVEDLTPEEYRQVHAHAQASTGGRFRLKPLAWAPDEAEAKSIAQAYTAPEWINVAVRQIAELGHVIPDA